MCKFNKSPAHDVIGIKFLSYNLEHLLPICVIRLHFFEVNCFVFVVD